MRLWIFLLAMAFHTASHGQVIRVGAKHFNEGYILSELFAQLLEAKGHRVERAYNLGGTLVCFEALRTGAIDVYPEYTGTIASEILGNKSLTRLATDSLLRVRFALEQGPALGFANTYGLVMAEQLAIEKQILTITDLQRHPDLATGISYEFLKRNDGWDALARRYQLPQHPTGLEHGLAYQALVGGTIQLTDAYSTDGEISVHGLRLLRDDQQFFPDYQAVPLLRGSLPDSIKAVFSILEGKITETAMQKMNAEVLFENRSFEQVAASFLARANLLPVREETTSVARDIFKKAGRHLVLTLGSLAMAVLIGFPLALIVYRRATLTRIVLYSAGLLQTIPSIALLALMIPLVGIGITPAILALLLYALLPIVRNTLTGLNSVDLLLKNVADGLGMNRLQRLWWVEIPLALPVILAGIRTAAVISVGTATLAAFIGAGGLGEYIVTGLALNNVSLILHGAIPAAVLALLVEWGFEAIEAWLIAPHLRGR